MTTALFCTALLGFMQTKTAVDDTPKWTFELRLTPYHPRFSDDETNRDMLNTMFRKSFNAALIDDRPIMWGFELDHYFATVVGLLGVGGRVGYWKVTGRTRTCRDAEGNSVRCSSEEASSKETSLRGNTEQTLSIIPLSVFGVYRFDTLYREMGIPLVPYGKLGLDWHLWSVRVNGDVTKTARGNKAEGGVFGWHASAGLALNIDWMEPGARSSNRGGVHGSYLFGEATWIRGDGFGVKPGFDASDFAILAGVAIDFE